MSDHEEKGHIEDCPRCGAGHARFDRTHMCRAAPPAPGADEARVSDPSDPYAAARTWRTGDDIPAPFLMFPDEMKPGHWTWEDPAPPAPGANVEGPCPTCKGALMSVIADLEALPTLLRVERKRRGLTIRAAAEEIGVSPANVGRWELLGRDGDMMLSHAILVIWWLADG